MHSKLTLACATMAIVGMTFRLAQAPADQPAPYGPPAASQPVVVTKSSSPGVLLAYMATQADLIVSGRVGEISKGQVQSVELPDKPGKPVELLLATHKVTISEVLGGKMQIEKDLASTSQPAQDSTIEVFAEVQEPGMDQGRYFAKLELGKDHYLVLRKMPGRKDYWLMPNPLCCMLKELLAKAVLERAIHVEKWPWGKVADGLQMAMIVHSNMVSLPGRDPAPGLAKQGTVFFNFVLRNTTDKPITVNLNPPDKLFAVEVTGPDGKSTRHELSSELRSADELAKAVFDAGMICTIKPGEMIFVGPDGLTQGVAQALTLPIAPGKWTCQAAYENTRAEGPKPEVAKNPTPAGAAPAKLWKNKVLAGEVVIEADEPATRLR